MKIVLVGCVAQKLDRPALAQDLYVSQWFRLARRYAEQHGSRWFILSAQHGLLRPDQPVYPYDKALKEATPDERERWADRVEMQLRDVVGPHDTVEIIAPAAYADAIAPRLPGITSGHISTPLRGLGIGAQKGWMKARIDETVPLRTPPALHQGTIDQPLRFASGMSRPNDFRRAFAAGAHVGIDIGELSEVSIATGALAQAMADGGGCLFVDSGAYGLFKRISNAEKAGAPVDWDTLLPDGVDPMDFDRVIGKYYRLLRSLQSVDPALPKRAFFVMPDFIDPVTGYAATRELLEMWAPHIENFAAAANVIINLQGSPMISLPEIFERTMDEIGWSIRPVVGIAAKAGVDAWQVAELLRQHGYAIPAVHILGAAAPGNPQLQAVQAALRSAGYTGSVSADATSIRVLLRPGQREQAFAHMLRTLYDTAPAELASTDWWLQHAAQPDLFGTRQICFDFSCKETFL